MDDLVETLAIGLFVSLILIFISWWFWKRYDKPSEAQIEREESIAKKKEETKMWRAVEAQIVEEKAASEQQALYERRKAEERARAMPPPVSEVSNAFAAFEMQQQSQPTFSSSQPKSTPEFEVGTEVELEEEVSDDDVLLVEDAIEVRQDQGVHFEQNVNIPSAPDLDALLQSSPPAEQEWTLEEVELDDSDWSDNWFKNLEEE